jgi:hypothetical protein
LSCSVHDRHGSRSVRRINGSKRHCAAMPLQRDLPVSNNADYCGVESDVQDQLRGRRLDCLSWRSES